MAVLHLLATSPYHSKGVLQLCLSRMGTNDALLLLQDGVYAVTTPLLDKLNGVNVFALIPDIEARGLEPEKALKVASLIGYAEFVDLVAAYPKNISWT